MNIYSTRNIHYIPLAELVTLAREWQFLYNRGDTVAAFAFPAMQAELHRRGHKINGDVRSDRFGQ